MSAANTVMMTIKIAEGVTCPVCAKIYPIIVTTIPKIFGAFICVSCGAFFNPNGVTDAQLSADMQRHLIEAIPPQAQGA